MSMTVKDYKDRLAKSEDKLQKIETRIQKWENNKSDKSFAKEYDWLKDDVGWRLGWNNGAIQYGTFEEFKAKNYDEWLRKCDQEIKYANSEKQDTIVTMNKYKNAIALLQEKEDKPVIQIFKDFFDKWKEAIIKYVDPNVALYYETNTKAAQLSNNRFNFKELGFETKDELMVEIQKLKAKEEALKDDSFIGIAIEKRYRWGTEDFNKFLDDYMNGHYFELVDKVTNIVGEIQDVSNLRVGYDGRLNGNVFGSQGGAKLETIIAGGYNIQCRHYRVLVHPIKQ